MEAMIGGKIVVTSDFPANLDLITTGETGFTFRNGDALALFQTINLILNKDNVELTKIRERAQSKALEIGNWSLESKRLIANVYSLLESKDIND
jgi:glycosyltransferase involved in cell wall biosynthesis